MRVALVSLGSFYDHSLALDYLVAYASGKLGRGAVEFRSFIDGDGRSGAEIVGQIRDFQPDMVGFSTYVWNIRASLAAARSIKGWRSSTVVVFGGMEATFNAESLLAEPDGPDFVVVGEGEIPFVVLLEQMLDQRNFAAEIPGLAWKAGGRARMGGMAPAIACLDDIPSPFQADGFAQRGLKRILYESYRGCAFRCSFCLYHRDYARCRYFSHHRIAADLACIVNAGVTDIRVVDATFNLNRQHAKSILRALQGCQAKVCIETSAEFFDKEMVSLLPGAGIRHVDIGLQSTQPAALHAVGRDWYRSDRFRQNIELLRSEPALTLNFELIAGLPSDGMAGLRSSLDDAVSMWPDHVSVYRLLGLHGTVLERDAEALGLSFSVEPPYELVESAGFSIESLLSVDELVFANLLLLNMGIGRFALRYIVEQVGMRPSTVYDQFLDHVKSRGLYDHDELCYLGRFHAYGNRFDTEMPSGLNFSRVDRAITSFLSDFPACDGAADVSLLLPQLLGFGRSLAALDLVAPRPVAPTVSTALRPRLAPWCRGERYDPSVLAELIRQGHQFGDLAPADVAIIIFFVHPHLGPAALAADETTKHAIERIQKGGADFNDPVVEALRELGIAIGEEAGDLQL